MEVTFFRHGIAVDRADPLAPVDFERPLTLDGKNKTEAAARGLRALDLKPSLVVSSPYRRCVQSARVVAEAFALPKKSVVELECLAPGGDPGLVWPELERLGREALICVGHGGALEPVAGFAIGLPSHLSDDAPGAPDLAYRTLHLKKSGALHLTVGFAPEPHGRLEWLLSPKILRQLGRR